MASPPPASLCYVGGPLDSYYVDHDSGLPLAGGILTFYRDQSMTTLKPIYTLTGTPPNYTMVELPNPLTLSAVGTAQDAAGNDVVIYYYPYIIDSTGNLVPDLYYITATDANGNPQWTREGWPFLDLSANPGGSGESSSENQIANSQFSRVFINPIGTSPVANTVVYTASSWTNVVCSFAPNWFFTITGTGTVTVTRTAVEGANNLPHSPPYYISVNVGTGITSCILTQRFYANSGLWTSLLNVPSYLSAEMSVLNLNAGTVPITMSYNESAGMAAPLVIISGNAINSGWTILHSNLTIQPISMNTNIGNAGYIDIFITFPPVSNTALTNIQVVPITSVSTLAVENVSWDPNSSNREQALMGDYYIPALSYKPIPSILQGWDFTLNPAQFGSSGAMPATDYIWDQTIAGDSSASGTYTRSTIAGGLAISTAAATPNACYVLQYLSGSEVDKLLSTNLSVNVSGFSNQADVLMRVYLCSGNVSATIPVLPSVIGSVSGTGVFTLSAANWAIIPRSNLDTASCLLNQYSGTPSQLLSGNDYGFNGWALDSTTYLNNKFFAIIVTFSYQTDTPIIVLDSISVVPGDIPTRPAPQSAAAVLVDCQQYYQKSFPQGVTPAVNLPQGNGEVYFALSIRDGLTMAFGPNVNFPVPMRTTPHILVYSPSPSTNATAYDYSQPTAFNTSTVMNQSSNGFHLIGNISAASTGDLCAVSWSADARLGKV